jgi:hypothetical protein
MGRDYRHTKKSVQFEDGYELQKNRKLTQYDRNKSRKNNKINPNELVLPNEEDRDVQEEDENGMYEFMMKD